MSLAPSRPQHRSAVRTVLLGYLLKQGANDRVLQILLRVDPERIDALLLQLAPAELTALAALLARPEARAVLGRLPDEPLHRLLSIGLPNDCRTIFSAMPVAEAARHFVALAAARRHFLVRAGAWRTPDTPKSVEKPGPFAAFRLRRLFHI